MPMTPQNLVRHELIGLKVKIKKSTDPGHVDKSGMVVDESYSTITIHDKSDSKIPKSNSVFIFTIPSRVKVEIEGSVIVGRPEDRIKKKLPKW